MEKTAMIRWSIALVVAAFLAGTACRSTETPRLAGPGTAQQQQIRAQDFDPYPSTEAGPGGLTEGRPRDYQKPPPETARAKADRWPFSRWPFTRPTAVAAPQ